MQNSVINFNFYGYVPSGTKSVGTEYSGVLSQICCLKMQWVKVFVRDFGLEI